MWDQFGIGAQVRALPDRPDYSVESGGVQGDKKSTSVSSALQYGFIPPTLLFVCCFTVNDADNPIWCLGAIVCCLPIEVRSLSTKSDLPFRSCAGSSSAYRLYDVCYSCSSLRTGVRTGSIPLKPHREPVSLDSPPLTKALVCTRTSSRCASVTSQKELSAGSGSVKATSPGNNFSKTESTHGTPRVLDT